MKAKTTRITAAVLVSAVAVCGLAGCGKSETAENSKAEVGAQTEAGASDEKVTLNWYTWEANVQNELQAMAEEYTKVNPNVTVQVEVMGDANSTSYLEKLDVMTMGGEEMDIVMQPSFATHSARAASDALLPLDDFMKAEGITMGEEYVIDTPVNGSYYALPADLKSWYVLMNKDDLDEAGLPVPGFDWTWEDYKEYAVKLTHGEGADTHYGSFMQASNDRYCYLPMWAEKQDDPFFKDENTLNFDDPLFKEFLEYRYDLENVSKCQTPYSDVKALSMNYRDQFFNGKVSMLAIGSYTLPDISNQEKYPHDFVTTFAPIPKWNETTEGGGTITECHYYGISKNSTHPQEAYDFLRWLTTEGYQYKPSSLSAQKGVDRYETFVSNLSEDAKKFYDLDALNNLYNSGDWKDNFYTINTTYRSSLESMVKEESEKYLLGQQSMEDTVANYQKRAEEIKADAQ